MDGDGRNRVEARGMPAVKTSLDRESSGVSTVFAHGDHRCSVHEIHHERRSEVEARDIIYESHSTGTFKACASFAMVSGVPVRRPFSRSDR
jgi:hypothetical protein